MNRLPSFVRQHIAGLRTLLLFTVITGIIYPLVMTGIAQVLFKNQANGSLVSYKGRVVGSSLLCQEFVDAKGNPLPQYFQPRPSFAIVGRTITVVTRCTPARQTSATTTRPRSSSSSSGSRRSPSSTTCRSRRSPPTR
jgi:K+-transporting ATPase c subunit